LYKVFYPILLDRLREYGIVDRILHYLFHIPSSTMIGKFEDLEEFFLDELKDVPCMEDDELGPFGNDDEDEDDFEEYEDYENEEDEDGGDDDFLDEEDYDDA
jgi:hypothetical protein